MPNKTEMAEIEKEWPKQALYMSRNFTLYIVSLSTYFASCFAVYMPGCNYCFPLGLYSFYVGIYVWNFGQTNVVFDDAWQTSEYTKAQTVMMWMWWMRTIPASLVFCCIGCFSC